jgi:hypothetical protein
LGEPQKICQGREDWIHPDAWGELKVKIKSVMNKKHKHWYFTLFWLPLASLDAAEVWRN